MNDDIFILKRENSKEGITLMDYVRSIFNSPVASDIAVELLDLTSGSILKKYSLHKVLLVQCSYFESMIRGGFKESTQSCIQITLDGDLTLVIMDCFFKMLYSDGDWIKYIQVDTDIIALHSLCVRMGFRRGEIECMELFRRNMETSLEIIHDYAVKSNYKEVENACEHWCDALRPDKPLPGRDAMILVPEHCLVVSRIRTAVAIRPESNEDWSGRISRFSYNSEDWDVWLFRTTSSNEWTVGISVASPYQDRAIPARCMLEVSGRISNTVASRDFAVISNQSRLDIPGLIPDSTIKDCFVAGIDFSPGFIGAGRFAKSPPVTGDLCLFIQLTLYIMCHSEQGSD